MQDLTPDMTRDATSLTPMMGKRPLRRFLDIVSAFLNINFAAMIAGSVKRQSGTLILWMPVFLGVGSALYFSLLNEPDFLLPVSSFILCLAFLCGCFVFGAESAQKYIITFALALCVLAGFMNAKWQTVQMYTPQIEKRTGAVDITGTIYSIGKLPKSGSQVVLNNLTIERIEPDKTPYSIRLKIYKDDGLQVGQRISVLGNINPPSLPVYPGGFDFQRYAYFQKLGGFGFAYRQPQILDQVLEGDIDDASYVSKARQYIQDSIYNNVDGESAAILTALLTGIRTGLAEDTESALRAAGLAHLLAISGLHIGLIAGALFFFSRLLMACFPYLALRFPIKKIAAVIALCGAGGYTIFVGAPIPTQRALMMTGIALFAIMIDRSPFSLRLVAVSASAILIWAPHSIMSISFQLSFAAVTGLVAFYEAMRPHLRSIYAQSSFWKRSVLYIGGIATTSAIATISTAPFTLFYFQKIAVYSILGNILALPIMAFAVMPMSILVFLLSPFGLEFIPLSIMRFGVDSILVISRTVQDLPSAELFFAALPTMSFALCVIAGLFLCLWQGRGRFAGLVLILPAIYLCTVDVKPDVLISEDGKLVSFHDGKHIYLSTSRSEKFTGEIWANYYGIEFDQVIPWPAADQHINCDDDGCSFVKNGKTIVVSFTPYSHRHDCGHADVLIARDPVYKKTCDAPIIIDRFDVWRNGAYALHLSDDHTRIEHVNGLRGRRFWQQ